MSGEKRAVRELASRLIATRWPIALGTFVVTAFFAWHAGQLSIATRPQDLRPRNHPFSRTQAQFGRALGGAGDLAILIESLDGHLFTPERLAQVYEITAALDTIRGLDNDGIDSIAHRTARTFDASHNSLGTGPLMTRAPRTDADANAIRHAVRRGEHLYGVLVSRDETATLVRAALRPGTSDYARILDDVESRVLRQREGWIGALFAETADARLRIEHVFARGAAAEAGLREGDLVATVNGEPVTEKLQLASAVAAGADAGVEIGFERDRKSETVTVVGGGSDLRIAVAGEASLYGTVERHAARTCAILAAAALCAGALLFLYFHDWRGAVGPAITAVTAAVWGLGFVELTGFGLDPLALIVPFFLSARAVVGSVLMRERYCEEIARTGVTKHDAIAAAYAVTFSAALTVAAVDAVVMLSMVLVPIAFVQKLAVSAAFWCVAIAVAELVLAPIVLYWLRTPDAEALERRVEGELQRLVTGVAQAVLAPAGRTATLVLWIALALACASRWPAPQTADSRAPSPILRADAPPNAARARIEEKLGAVDRFVVVAEGHDKNAMKDPQTLHVIEGLQHELQRDRAIGYSVSLVDVLRSANAVLHELEPRWGVIPDHWTGVGASFFARLGALPPGEATKIVSADYRWAPVTFFVRDTSPAALRRIVARTEAFIEKNPMDKAAFRLAGGTVGALVALNAEVERSVVLVNALGLAVVTLVVLFAYRSFAASFLAVVPLLLANFAATAAMAWSGTGWSAHTVVALGLGLGLGAQLVVPLIARFLESYAALDGKYSPEREDDRVRAALAEAMASTGKAIAFGAFLIVVSSAFWAASAVRVHAEAGLWLALWTAVAAAASLTLIPASIVVFRPAFVARAGRAARIRTADAERIASRQRSAGTGVPQAAADQAPPLSRGVVNVTTSGFARS